MCPRQPPRENPRPLRRLREVEEEGGGLGQRFSTVLRQLASAVRRHASLQDAVQRGSSLLARNRTWLAENPHEAPRQRDAVLLRQEALRVDEERLEEEFRAVTELTRERDILTHRMNRLHQERRHLRDILRRRRLLPVGTEDEPDLAAVHGAVLL